MDSSIYIYIIMYNYIHTDIQIYIVLYIIVELYNIIIYNYAIS